jgi:Rap1a immunity proteins
MRRLIPVFLGCSLASGLINADNADSGVTIPNTLHAVYQACTSTQPYAKGYCSGFVVGAMAEIIRTNHLCFLPEGVGPEEMIQELKKWHDAHREAWQNSASDATRSAFLAAWHCSH